MIESHKLPSWASLGPGSSLAQNVLDQTRGICCSSSPEDWSSASAGFVVPGLPRRTLAAKYSIHLELSG